MLCPTQPQPQGHHKHRRPCSCSTPRWDEAGTQVQQMLHGAQGFSFPKKPELCCQSGFVSALGCWYHRVVSVPAPPPCEAGRTWCKASCKFYCPVLTAVHVCSSDPKGQQGFNGGSGIKNRDWNLSEHLPGACLPHSRATGGVCSPHTSTASNESLVKGSKNPLAQVASQAGSCWAIALPGHRRQSLAHCTLKWEANTRPWCDSCPAGSLPPSWGSTLWSWPTAAV